MGKFNAEQVADESLGMSYELWGSAPVQAIGMIGHHEFYFRARDGFWEFETALASGDFGSDTGEKPAFFRTSRYPRAGFMPFDEAKRLIRLCALEYQAGRM